MNIISAISDFVEKHSLFDDKALIVGCSGGSDSVALLRILREITANDIYAVHVNHNLRGKDSDDDEKFVVSLCEELNVPCKVYSVDCLAKSKELKKSLEDTGRILRYESFDDYRRELFGEDYKAKSVICVAHHKDDLAETMLMNLFRGSGAEGLITPKPATEDIIRPLLCVTKKDILEYLDSIEQPYRTDATNFETDCTRNIWRNKIIPLINEASNKNASDALFGTYELLMDDMDYLLSESDKVFSKTYDASSGTVETHVFENISNAIASRVIRNMWLKSFGNLTDLEKVHVDKALELFRGAKSSGTTIDLPFGRVAFVAADRCGFCKAGELTNTLKVIFNKKGYFFVDEDFNLELGEKTINNTFLPQSNTVLSAQIVENINDLSYNCISWFCPIFDHADIANLKFGLVDLEARFGRAGSDTHKKVNRVLMDRKIPSCIRQNILGITRNDKVLWIPGIGHSEGFVDEKSRQKFLESLGDRSVPEKYLAVHLLEDDNGECRCF